MVYNASTCTYRAIFLEKVVKRELKSNTDSGAFHCTSGEVSSIHCPSLVSRDYVKQFLFRLFPVTLAYLCDLVFTYFFVLSLFFLY